MLDYAVKPHLAKQALVRDFEPMYYAAGACFELLLDLTVTFAGVGVLLLGGSVGRWLWEMWRQL